QNGQLMPKYRVLSLKPHLRLDWRGQDSQDETQKPDHSASLSDSVTSSTRIRFSVHTGDEANANDCYCADTNRPDAAKANAPNIQNDEDGKSPKNSRDYADEAPDGIIRPSPFAVLRSCPVRVKSTYVRRPCSASCGAASRCEDFGPPLLRDKSTVL